VTDEERGERGRRQQTGVGPAEHRHRQQAGRRTRDGEAGGDARAHAVDDPATDRQQHGTDPEEHRDDRAELGRRQAEVRPYRDADRTDQVEREHATRADQDGERDRAPGGDQPQISSA
jgi:hypothetical protein